MKPVVRVALVLIGTAQLVAAVALIMQWPPPLVEAWPFPNTTPLTFIFVASILAAAAASQLWAAATQNYGAMAGIGLDYLAIFAAMTFLLPNLVFAALSAATAVFGLALFLWARRIPIPAQPPQPRPVRWSFAVFVVSLFAVGGLVVVGVPNVIPWSITPQLSVVAAWMFIGAALYFLYSLLAPSWLNSAGQLLGFLAYDVVLIVPFLTRFPTTPPEFALGLTVYTAVVVYSAVLAVYYLFVNRATRAATWRRAVESIDPTQERDVGDL